VDLTVTAVILVMLASGGRIAWLRARDAIAIAVMLVLMVASLVRLRRTHKGTTPFRTPLNLRLMGRELPLGLIGPGPSLPRADWP
jgi:hypothetical protein